MAKQFPDNKMIALFSYRSLQWEGLVFSYRGYLRTSDAGYV